MQSWALEELQHADLGDIRLNKRLEKIVEELAAQPEASVPQACGTWAATKATYRFWDNPRVYPEDIISGHQRYTKERLQVGQSHLKLVVEKKARGQSIRDIIRTYANKPFRAQTKLPVVSTPMNLPPSH